MNYYSIFTIRQVCPEGSDSTAPYKIYFLKNNPHPTVKEFVDCILEECRGEWGTIRLKKEYKICAQYSHGSLVDCGLLSDYSDCKIKSASAYGGWSLMDYEIVLETDSEEPKEDSQKENDENHHIIRVWQSRSSGELWFGTRKDDDFISRNQNDFSYIGELTKEQIITQCLKNKTIEDRALRMLSNSFKKTIIRTTTTDEVEHPSHYTQGNIECIDAIESALTFEQFIGYLKGCIIKYIWRCDHKKARLKDVEKEIWYSNKLKKTLAKHEKEN